MREFISINDRLSTVSTPPQSKITNYAKVSEHIPSSCPQGRGRVERVHRAAQDSLLKEMVNQIDLVSKDEAAAMTATNAFLPGWIVQRNTAFAVPTGNPEDAHRPCPYEHEAMRLILSVTDNRKPRKNQPFSYNGQLYPEILN